MNKPHFMNPTDQEIQAWIDSRELLPKVVAGEHFLDDVLHRLHSRKPTSRRITGFLRSHAAGVLVTLVLLINVIAVGLGLQSYLSGLSNGGPTAENRDQVLFIDPGQHQLYNYLNEGR